MFMNLRMDSKILMGSMVMRPFIIIVFFVCHPNAIYAMEPRVIEEIAVKDVVLSIHDAAKNGEKETVELLLAAEADINSVNTGDSILNTGGSTPLHLAAENGHIEVVELLLAKGADIKAVNYAGWAPLHFAVLNGYKEVVELLLAEGADVGALLKDGKSSLHIAAEKGHIEVIKVLLIHGADANVKDTDWRLPVDVAQTKEVKALLQERTSSCVLC